MLRWSHRVLAVLAVCASWSLVSVGPAVASDPVTGIGDGNGAVIRGERGPSEDGGQAGEVERGDGAVPGDVDAEPAPPGSYEPRWSVAPQTGRRCVALVYRPEVPPNSAMALEWELRIMAMVDEALAEGASPALCQPEAAVVPRDVALAASDFVRRIPLPEPQPHIDPGFALTGLPTYLVIEDQDGFGLDEQLVGWGAMRVALRPVRFVVDWGDGTVEVVSDGRTGARYDGDPAEQISHTYRWRDPDTAVTVRSDWRARWEVGGFSGTVDGLSIDAVLGLPVREYRAVRADR